MFPPIFSVVIKSAQVVAVEEKSRIPSPTIS